MKKLFIDYYTDGFNVEQINCHDLTIACASGAYSYDNYFFYCFLHAIYSIWFPFRKNIRNDILELLGLQLKPITIESPEGLITQIKIAIDSKKPVLLTTRYNRLFYAPQFGKETDKSIHTLLIDGYDENKSIVRLRDFIFIRTFFQSTFGSRVDAFADLNIKQEYLIEIWKNSKIDGVEGVYILEKVKDSNIKSYKDLIEFYINHIDIKESTYSYLKTESINFNDLRDDLYHTFVMLCNIFKKAFKQNHWDFKNIDCDEFIKSMQNFISNRNLLVNRIIKDVIKKQIVTDSLIEELKISDQSLYDYICTIYNKLTYLVTNNEENQDNLNLALNAMVIADSEGKNALAINAVDGKIENDFDCWKSTHMWDTHWLLVDIGEIKTIHRFIIKHHPENKMLVTQDFKIEGSLDSNEWDVLAEIKNNTKHENDIRIQPVAYRYFRLYITKPNILGDNSARIFSFEIY